MAKTQAMLAEEITGRIDEYLTDPRWAIEQKLDGHRVLLICYKGELHVVNRNHEKSQHHYRLQKSSWLSNLLPLRGRYVVLDAELIGDTAWVFDSPMIEGIIDEDTPWRYRNVMLAGLFHNADFNHHIEHVPSAITTDQKITIVEKCIENHAEGIMIKDKEAPYVPGRSSAMYKYKFVHTADLIVLRIGEEGKVAATLGAWDENALVEVGRCSLLGKELVEVGDVVEVKYLYFSDGGRLVQPVMLRRRDDKTTPECTLDQLRSTNKAVISP